MRPRIGLALFLFSALILGPRAVAATPIYLEVQSVSGATLGQLAGVIEDRVTYFPLADIARVARGKVRRAPSGDRATLEVRGRTLEVQRDSPRARLQGRVLALSAPVRVREGTWVVPGEVLVRALPVLVGAGVQVVAVSAPPPRPVPRPVTAVRAPPLAARLPVAPPTAAPADSRPAPSGAERPGEAVAPVPPAPESEPAPSAPVRAGAIELRYRSYPAYTRVALEGTAPFEPRLVEANGALVVPLAGLRGRAPRVVRAVRDGLIDSVELTESRGSPALRVTFERAPASRKVYRLQDPPRLILDFYRAAPATASGAAPRPALHMIIIDPGHGGHDPGAIGPGGLQEKELTLDVARRLAAVLEAEVGAKVRLTRTRDQFVALRERTGIANRHKADLFVSIHVNAARGVTATGTETYFLSSEATDNAARAAAAFENKVIELEPDPRAGSRDLLRSILWDLAQSEFQQQSSRLAEALQDSFERALRLPNRGVKQAPFYVLGGAAMPAVLVEIGFLSNPQEEQRLQDEGYRDRIARALAAGIAAYKRRYEQKGGVVAGR
ncbi:MAG TPA: N-acetylmuramoyl-L-alanine amidase [Methylomirabilota bacterium]|nr:N-acetylmuramoyl-L-alanine amidase [Methylomirabilota bacterium]